MENNQPSHKRFTSKVSYDGRVTIPETIREVLKIRAGDVVDIDVYEPEGKKR